MLGMASNAKEKQRKGERKSSRGSREKKEGNEGMRKRGRGGEKRQLARLVASLGNNSMAKSIDAARRWPRAPRFALPCRATPTNTVCCPKSWWPARLVVRLVGLVALVALVAPPASSAPSSSSAASKQKVKLNYFCNMQHATKMATMSALSLLSLCSASVLQPD